MSIAVQPRHFPPGDGAIYKIGQMTMTFKTTAERGWNAYTVCEAIEPPASGAGLHRHPTYDETFIICEGHYDFQLDKEMLRLGAGDAVFVPRGTPHSFLCVGPEVGRQLIISSPGGIFDAFIAEVAASMVDSGSPSTPGVATDFRAIATKYGMEFLS
jgi:mannose-6-phosphate isomerase-like protein (cupin superfamily)